MILGTSLSTRGASFSSRPASERAREARYSPSIEDQSCACSVFSHDTGLGLQSTGSIDLLALARSPDDLRSSLRAVKEKYLESLPTTTVEHDFGVWCGRLGISTFRSDTGRAEVGSVKTCSKAKSYGMQIGDTILELDGQRVDHDAFKAGLAAARRAKRTVRLLIARGA